MSANARPGDRYRLLEHVGSGGMSTVWRGYDEVLRRRVAVKVLNPQYVSDVDVRASLYREAQAVALLAHPHIASVFDYGERVADSHRVEPFVVMEFVPGPTLSSVLAREGTLPWPEGGVICAQVASALAAAHSAGIVHRDVKPGNIILGATGAKVVDFGISALVGENDYDPDGQLLGTPAYVAPERLTQGKAGTAADVYALGMLLYRTLAGGLPWEAETVTEMLLAHRYVDPNPLPALSGIPAPARELCEQCLAKDPVDRPSSADVANRLAELVGISLPVIGVHHGRTEVEELATMSFTTADLTQPVSARSVADSAGSSRVPRPLTLAVAAGLMLLLAGFVVPFVSAATPSAHVLALTAETPDDCAVRFVVSRQSEDGFDADVNVTNSGRKALTEAVLRFSFAGDQAVASTGPFVQKGHEVTTALTRAGEALPAGGSVAVHLNGTYHAENLLPTVFYIGATRCDAAIGTAISTPAAPGAVAPPTSQPTSQPVSHAQPAAPTPPVDKHKGPPAEDPKKKGPRP